MTNGADRERGEELHAIVVEPDPRLQRLRRLDEWLSRLTVWQQLLLFVPFALVIAGIAIWLNSVPPPVDLKFTFPFASFGDVDCSDLMGIVWAAGPKPGTFVLDLDNIRVE